MKIEAVNKAGVLLTTVQEVADYLHTDTTVAETALLTALIEAAQQDMEAYCHASLVRRDVKEYWGVAELSTGFGQEHAGEAWEYRNTLGQWVGLAKQHLQTDDFGEVVLLDLPTDAASSGYVLRRSYEAGYTADTFPKNGKVSLWLWIGRMYDVRADEQHNAAHRRTVEILWDAFRNVML